MIADVIADVVADVIADVIAFHSQDPTAPTRQIAIRIKTLPKGTVSFETVLPEKLTGTIEKEPKGKEMLLLRRGGRYIQLQWGGGGGDIHHSKYEH